MTYKKSKEILFKVVSLFLSWQDRSRAILSRFARLSPSPTSSTLSGISRELRLVLSAQAERMARIEQNMNIITETNTEMVSNTTKTGKILKYNTKTIKVLDDSLCKLAHAHNSCMNQLGKQNGERDKDIIKLTQLVTKLVETEIDNQGNHKLH